MKIKLTDERAMRRFGAKIGKLLKGGELLELIGDVGAGKTTFSKGLAKGMGILEVIQSPSFTISRVYSSEKGLNLHHYDFYRLNEAGIMASDLNEVLTDKENAVIIEWSDIVADILPKDRLQLEITTLSEDGREIVLKAGGELSEKLLAEIAKA